MPTAADPNVDMPLLASEFFDYISHLTDIQEPDCYSTDMDEKELRAKVSHQRTQYGIYNPDYVHLEEATEEFVSIGDMDDTPPQEDTVEIVVDNSWNVLNNQVLKNSLLYDQTILSKIDVIAASNAQTAPSHVSDRNIALVRESILAKEMFSFSEANKAGSDTSSFNIDFSVPLEQRYDTLHIPSFLF